MPATIHLHLVVPPIEPALAAECLDAACAAGDVASVLAEDNHITALMPIASRNSCVLLARTLAAARSCDGAEVSDAQAYAEARRIMGKDKIVGAYCGTSRHFAMEMAEQGADYVAFAQSQDRGREPVIVWWSELFEIPCIAADPVAPENLAPLLTYNPDFIRPDDAMWTSPAESRRIVAATMKALAR